MSAAKDRVNWNVFKAELFMACQTKLEIKSMEIIANRCDIDSPWNHREALIIYLFSLFIYNLFYVE